MATGSVVLAFPAESRPWLEELYALWFSHAWDNIFSVREDAAVALGNVVRAYGDEALQRVLVKVRCGGSDVRVSCPPLPLPTRLPLTHTKHPSQHLHLHPLHVHETGRCP